jgi:hypothetical protein
VSAVGSYVIGRADRLVSLGSLAVRPVVYRGTVGDQPLTMSSDPIEGLRVRSTTSQRTPLFHVSTNLYGFVDLAPGLHRVHVVDPEQRFLPRAVAAIAPDRSLLGDALARGARTLPVVDDPPLVSAKLRPSPSSLMGGAEAALHGVILDVDGEGAPFAWIRAQTLLGEYVTYSDARGEYVVPLPFLHPVIVTDPSDPTQSKHQTTFPVTLEVYPLLAALASVVASGDPLDVFPADFDDLAPGSPRFGEVYDPTKLFSMSTNATVGARARLDPQLA